MERGPDAWFTFHRNPASMYVDDVFHNLRSESGPADFPADRMVGEQALPDFGGHALPCVNDRHHDALSLALRAALDCYRATRRHFRYGVVHQVIEGVELLALIRLDRGKGVEPIDAQGDATFPGGDTQNRI